ncbi:unnamed protein product [Durusdinium trenchii]|uniref:SET domain-containing protein n=1 Tax=Durusdinium trenchii TaxID=1381693 RepID=A0ABP0HJ78_9DINO
MTGLDNVGTRSKRREKKHYDEHQDTRCVWEAFGSAAPSRSPSPSPSVPCSPQGAAAGRVLDAGFYDLHIGGRKARGHFVQNSQVWRCLLPQAHTEARGGAPQDTMQKGADWSVEYGFGRLGKPVARTSQVALEWPELRVANAPTLDASRGKSRVGHFGQDSHQTMACLQMMPSGREHVTVSPRGASPGRSINPTNDSWVGWSKEEGQASVKEQAELLSQEEVRAGMVRRAGRRLRPTSPNNALRHVNAILHLWCRAVSKRACDIAGFTLRAARDAISLSAEEAANDLGSERHGRWVGGRFQRLGWRSRDPVAAGDTEEKGKCLVAASKLEPGELAVLDRPAMVHDLDSEDTETIWSKFQKLPKTLQEEILSLFCPEGLVHSLKDSEGYMDATTEQQKLLGTLKLNSVKLSGGTGAGVFLTVSRANHSCYPNTRFYFEEEMCGLKVLRSIEEGEEITVSYLTDRSLLQPIAPRQTSLQTWQFRCQCQRCAAPSDDARAMRCRCGALRRATAEGWGRCPTCGADDQEMRRASSRWWLRYNACAPLAAEAELSSCWWRRGMHGRPSKVKSQGWMEEVVALYRELATTEGPRPDPSVHWMGASLAAFAADARATGYRHLPKEHHEEIVTGEVPERGEREAVFGDHRRSCGLRFLLETDMFFVGMKGAMIVTFALYVHDCFALATEMNPSN